MSAGHGLARGEIVGEENSLWRYAAAIRVDAAYRVTLGEGFTPLVTTRFAGREVAMKLEFLAPTGSFKDRGMTVLMSYLRSVGVARILEDSSGNAGASMAAYAAACGMACRILVPASAPPGKLVQMRAMGAEVVPVAGTRQDVADQALREAEGTFYSSHNWQPFFLEGTKTLAFELWEQSGFTVPDAVVVPLGYGSNVLGLRIGFAELMRRGEIAHMPRIYGVQAANCSAFGAALDAGADHPVAFAPRPTIAGGIASQKPVRTAEVLAALRDSGGGLVRVSEAEIADGLRRLLAAGLFVEPTSAAGAAGLEMLLADGRIGPSETVVLVLTGSGLKAAQDIADMIAAPPR
ncbi:threonine synthase [Aquabacter spiritensis]|uniref:Threonine synthase n=1 Tax=Aquabacter spiritensis TaxID=933073 RepID=A0A4R3M142_9HYPH|nr:threonine synthase [Aquabacter spiritensis]TCT06780.1 threonine synthase [Aquabacter spiritensis]